MTRSQLSILFVFLAIGLLAVAAGAATPAASPATLTVVNWEE